MSTAFAEFFAIDPVHGTLTIGGVEMVWRAGPRLPWGIPDLSPLWGHPDVKGDDGPMPRASGRRPFPRRADGVAHQLPFLCTGWWDPDGVPTNYLARSAEAQLELNMAYLWDNVFAPVGSGTGTRVAVWTTASGNEISADVRARLPASNVALLPKGTLRAMLELEDPRSELHL